MKNRFEENEIFRQKLQDYSSEVPEDMWERIQQKKLKRRPLLLLFLKKRGYSLLLLLTLLLGGLFGWLSLRSGYSDDSTHAEKTVAADDFPVKKIAGTPPTKSQNTVTEIVPIQKKKRIQPAPPTIRLPKIKAGKAIEENHVLTETAGGFQAENLAEIADETLQNNEQPTPPVLHMLPTVLTFIQPDSPEVLLPKPLPDYRKPPKSKPLEFYMAALGGPGFNRQLLDAKRAESDGYQRRRAETENGRISWSAALRLTAIYNRRFTFSTGLSYSLINERFHWEKYPEVRPLYLPNQTYNQTGRRIKTTYNHYHFLELPLLIGYQLSGYDGGLSLNAGASFNLWFRPEGDFLAPGEQPASFTKNESGAYPAFKKSAGVRLFGSAQIGHDLNNHLRIMAEPFIYFPLTSLTRDSYSLTQKYFSAGLQMGLQLRL